MNYAIIKSQLYPVKVCIVSHSDVDDIHRKFPLIPDWIVYEMRENFQAHTIRGSITATSGPKKGSNEKCVYVLFNPNGYEPITTGSIAHEAFHVVEFIEEYIGEQRFSSEAAAYLIDWVADQCQDVISGT